MEFKRIHPWNLRPAEAINIQNKLRQKIKLRNFYIQPKLIVGVDVAFRRRKAFGAVVVLEYPEFKIIEYVCKTTPIPYPYIPGLLTFREGPVLEKCFRELKIDPDIIIFDGQGVAHPRNMGIATHLGILLNKPTIGCAKTKLFGDCKEPANYRGAFSYIQDAQGKKIGALLRTKPNVKGVYVSPGYKMDIASSISIIMLCTKNYRICEPIRLAHQLTKSL